MVEGQSKENDRYKGSRRPQKEKVMPIRKVKGGYKLKNVKGKSKTLKAAKRRLRAVKASQAERGKLKRKRKSTRRKRK